MRKPKSDLAGRNVHISPPAPVSVPPSYHKILGAVKRKKGCSPSWGHARNHRYRWKDDMTAERLGRVLSPSPTMVKSPEGC